MDNTAGYGQDFIGTEHLLLAFALDPDGIAGRVLDDLGVRDEVQTRMKEIIEIAGVQCVGFVNSARRGRIGRFAGEDRIREPYGPG